MRCIQYIALCATLALASCVSNSSLGDMAASEDNVSNLSRISLGMKSMQVMSIMHPPVRQECYRLGEDKYQVWFYTTNPPVLGQSRPVPFNLTPLIFRNRKLVGIGYMWYHWLKRHAKSVRKVVASPPAVEPSHPLQEVLQGTLVQPTAVEEKAPPPPPPPPPPKKPAPKGKQPPPSNKPEWNEDDEQRKSEEEEQEFDFW